MHVLMPTRRWARPSHPPHAQALATREMGSYVSELERVGTVGLSQFQFDRWV